MLIVQQFLENPKKNRYDYIDALRGLAALYVLFLHLTTIPNPHLGLPLWLEPIIMNGASGVTLFFVLSAFTLCNSMHKREAEAMVKRRFYVRRLFRILPLFYFWLILSLPRDYYSWGVSHSPFQILLSIFFLFNFFPSTVEGIVLASWTLGVELVFYFIFPFIYLNIKNYRHALFFFFITVVISTAFQYLAPIYIPTIATKYQGYLTFSILRQLPVFACGILAYFIYENFIKNKSVDKSWGVALIGLSLLGFSGYLSGKFGFLFDKLYWLALIYSCLVLGLAIYPVSLIVNRATTFLGNISYSLYLNHPSIVIFMIPIYRLAYSSPFPKSISFFLCALVTVFVVIVTSYLTYRVIEKPGIEVGDKVIKKLRASHET
jgi:peptidoglycan/LPS O-acetylase OafA/YrhL